MASSVDPIFVTRPFLPPLSELVPLLEEIWASKLVTNHGPFHQRLQEELAEFFGVEQVSLMTNGMLALEAALEAADVRGEVITSPYSFVATSHAVRRANAVPVFADVKPGDLNIDPAAVRAAITPRTSAIVAVHCYGNPCDVDALSEMAEEHRLALVYDAAHTFGVRYRGRALAAYGDLAALSFHGTKVFNTFEGGAVIAATEAGRKKIDLARNFGIASEVEIAAIGTNSKMSEFNAALGLVQLRYFEEALAGRAVVDARYREALRHIPGIEPLDIPDETERNYSYFPVLVTEGYPLSRDRLYEALKSKSIFSRRYFYPLLSNLPMYRKHPSADPANLAVANRAAEQILCLPIYPDLAQADQERVIENIREAVR